MTALWTPETVNGVQSIAVVPTLGWHWNVDPNGEEAAMCNSGYRRPRSRLCARALVVEPRGDFLLHKCPHKFNGLDAGHVRGSKNQTPSFVVEERLELTSPQIRTSF